MNFFVRLTDNAVEDLDFFPKSERRIIADGIRLFLTQDANVKTRRRKPLRPNPIAQGELRIDDYRVFYDFEDDEVVRIVAVGHKEHNDLSIRGKKVEL
jgi:mRNA-degrading endonuclease RelE of RelBE toxin-antitoxin system